MQRFCRYPRSGNSKLNNMLLTAVPVDDTEPPALEDGFPNVTVGFSAAAVHIRIVCEIP
jgi:hypothetical protein